MMSVFVKSAAALAAAAGLAYTAADDALLASPYEGRGLTTLTASAVADHAVTVFHRADRNQDGYLDVDEYTALEVVSAELARLNGFVVIEGEDGPHTLGIRNAAGAALGEAEQIRVAAVARSAFYQHAGDDGRIDEQEFANAERAAFDVADFNRDGALKKRELDIFALRQANIAADA